MNEFFRRLGFIIAPFCNQFTANSIVVTICAIIVLKHISFDFSTNIHNDIKPTNTQKSESMPYELVNESTRFNKQTGELEFRREYPANGNRGAWRVWSELSYK